MLNDETLAEQGKRMFMEYTDHNTIAKTLKVSSTTVAAWRNKHNWVIEREESERGIIEDAFAGRRLSISRICKSTTEEIERGLAHLRTRPNPPTIQEVERLSVILSNLDKIARLDSNKSTENIALKAEIRLSAEQIREIVKKDPFFPT